MTGPARVELPSGGAVAIVKHRGWIVAGWILACTIIVPLAHDLDRRLVPAGRVPGSESQQVENALANRFSSPYARYAVLVVTGLDVRTAAGEAALREIVETVGKLPIVSGVISPITSTDTLLVGSGGGAIIVAGIRPRALGVDTIVGLLRSSAYVLTGRLRAQHPSIALRWTGEDPLNLDLRRASSADVRRSELRVLPLTALLLLLTFGGVVAALLPVMAGVIAIAVSLGIGSLIAAWHPTSLLYQNVVSILGLSLGIDYALLIVSRVREARRDGLDPTMATTIALTHGGHTVALAGAAVVVGFAALLAVPLDELKSIGAGGLVVATISMLVATLLLPAVLAWLGDRVGKGRGRPTVTVAWRRWSTLPADRPWTVLGVAALPLVLLGWQAPRMRTELPSGEWLPAHAESATAVRVLKHMRRQSLLEGIRLLIQLPAGITALSPAGWSATDSLVRHLARDGRVGRVRALPAYAAGAPLGEVRALLPDSMRRIFVSADSSLALIEVTPRSEIDMAGATRLVRDLRGATSEALTKLPGTRVLVGGLPAFNADYEDVVGGHFRFVIALVLGGTFIALLVGFRSVLVPIKAIVMNLLTVTAAYGAVVLVFQDGIGARLLGLAGPLDAVFPTLPVLVFCTVFGISMDYEVFLIARVAEARRSGQSERDAIVHGLVTAGGVITSAATIMVVVFGAFALGDFLPTKILGFALGVAVLADATLVRLAIGPALLRLAGDWNWWPGHTIRHQESR